MSKPIAVLTSDVHYNLTTLPLADAAMRLAISTANRLNVPLIVAGDLHDSKANLRAECVNAMLETFNLCQTLCVVLVGNHDKLNEKSASHALNFLCRDYTSKNGDPVPERAVIEQPWFYYCMDDTGSTTVHLIPYQHETDQLKSYLKTVDKGSTVIMHQGLTSSNMGDYIQDKSAINPEDVAGLRVISGHYHTRQTIVLPDGGSWDYIGNPYTTSWGEANDPPKGFQILMSDGSLEFVPTNLRKHVVYDLYLTHSQVLNSYRLDRHDPDDLVWLKLRGSTEAIKNFKPDVTAAQVKIDWYPDEVAPRETIKYSSQPDMFDSIIDRLDTTGDQKQRLKKLWRSL